MNLGWKQIDTTHPAWQKIWKPVVISEWFPTPDHHDHHHEHHEDHHDHHEHGWDRKDTENTDSKVVWKREQPAAQPSNVQSPLDAKSSTPIGSIQPKVSLKKN